MYNEQEPPMGESKTLSASNLLKIVTGFGTCVACWVIAQPSIWAVLWRRGDLFTIVLAPIVFPVVIIEGLRILVWRVRLEDGFIEIRSLTGSLVRKVTDIARLEKRPRQLRVTFNDRTSRTIPSFVGDLFSLQEAIAPPSLEENNGNAGTSSAVRETGGP